MLAYTALFIIAPKWKLPKCSSILEWINEMWCIHTVEYYTATKRKKPKIICNHVDESYKL